MDIYSYTLTAWRTVSLISSRSHIGAASVAGIAVFAAGRIAGGGRTKDVDYFDISTGLWTSGQIPGTVSRDDMAATSVGNLAFFTKGTAFSAGCKVEHRFSPKFFILFTAYSVLDTTVYVFNATTRLWSTAELSQSRGRTAAVSVGPLALLAGGSMDGMVLLRARICNIALFIITLPVYSGSLSLLS